ncbi:hypothetical protein [Devosia submarina]|nr:hypothetical protein [Devosia submarina]
MSLPKTLAALDCSADAVAKWLGRIAAWGLIWGALIWAALV